ncbi:hypothetical protein F4801DRAFT_585406 [Xylaria longipes]|nr:hypothetical protein F4801DRAFT_585406 [Xylaria longipes]
MKAIIAVFCIFTTAAIGATIPAELEERQPASGWFPFEDSHCCITYGVCECVNGWFYEWNEAENSCQ